MRARDQAAPPGTRDGWPFIETGASDVVGLTQWMEAGLGRLAHSDLNPLRSVVAFRSSGPVAALTFDDGPDPRYTPRLLDVLDRHGARATFFMIGRAAERCPDVVEEVARRGHCVANHTYSHPSLPRLPGRERRAEIRRCGRALEPHGRHLFRPPKGHQTPATRLDVLRCGFETVGWSVAAEDWLPREPEAIADRVLAQLAPGSIVLLHDGLWDPESRAAADRSRTVDAVDLLLERCVGRFRFRTLPTLLRAGTPVREAWFHRPPGPREHA